MTNKANKIKKEVLNSFTCSRTNHSEIFCKKENQLKMNEYQNLLEGCEDSDFWENTDFYQGIAIWQTAVKILSSR